MARSYRHWTPRYVVDRLRLMLFERMNPGLPWMGPRAVRFLDAWLRPRDRGLEWGSGRSTVWLARRIARLTSVEHDPAWHGTVRSTLLREGIGTVDYRLAPVEDAETPSAGSSYLSVADEFPPASLDVVLVDGLYRDRCAQAAIGLLKPGGLLVIDNANWYLPHATRSPNSVGAAGVPATELWKGVSGRLSSWKPVWTSSGVTDTAFFIKPGARVDGTA